LPPETSKNIITVNLEGVRGLLKGPGSEAAAPTPPPLWMLHSFRMWRRKGSFRKVDTPFSFCPSLGDQIKTGTGFKPTALHN
ncbi:MAG TPA: hypothetical protein VF130_00690, partial [Candidatus Binatia bacterium]